MNKHIQQRGFGLVELMVAITIGLFLVFGLVSMLVDSRKSYHIQDELARVQENGRFAVEFMARDIRMAGFYGCVSDVAKVTNNLANTIGDLFEVGSPIEGFEQGQTQWKPSNSTDAVGNFNANTDAITLRFANPTSEVTLQAAMSDPSAVVSVPTASAFVAGDVLVIQDCDAADIFQVTAATNGQLSHAGGATTPGNNDGSLSKGYADITSASIMRLRAIRYFIDDNSDGIPVLRRQLVQAGSGVAAAVTDDIVEGIENMQLLYGEDTDGDGRPDGYVQANNVTSWPNVVSVQVGLLARTIEPYGGDLDRDDGTHSVLTYNFSDTSLNVKRRVFTTTVSLRNI